MGLTSAGIGSGLDVNSIVSQLMAAEQQPLNHLTAKKSEYQAKLTAFGSVKSALSQFQSVLQTLSDAQKIQAVSATSTDPAVITASAAQAATPGKYSIEVSQLAQAQKLATTGQSAPLEAIGTGVLTFDFGTLQGGTVTQGKYSGASYISNGLGAKTVTIDPSNNSLLGICDAINAAAIGVSASIVNDGSAAPYRLALTNSQTGEAQSMKISVSGDADLVALISHNPADSQGQNLTETVKAQNAKLLVDGIPISKNSNTIVDAVAGVVLTLKKTNVGSTTSLDVARDAQAVTTAITSFVTAYNKIDATLNNLSSYDQTAKKGAVLNGDSSIRSIRNQMRSILSSALPETAGSLTRLNQVGVELQTDGTLKLNQPRLDKAVAFNFKQLAGLFSATGTSSDSQVSFQSSSIKTKTGSYALTVDQLATQGVLLGQTPPGLNISAGNNDSLQVTLDGLTETILLTAGNYPNANALAAEIQSRINGVTSFSTASSAVSVTVSAAGLLNLNSSRYGSGSSIVLGGNAAQTLLGGGGTASRGIDLTGSLNGVAVLSSGQLLKGAAGSAVDGLSLRISGGVTGNRGNVNYTQGFAYQLDRLAATFLEDNGLVKARTDGIGSMMKKIDASALRLQDRLKTLEKHYRDQFTALDTTMSKMNSTSSYLTQQLATLAKAVKE